MTVYPPGIAASLLVHIVAGSLGLATGYVALFSPKGAVLHRGSGRVFVYAMTTMGLTGALIAALGATQISVIAGVVTEY